MLVAAVHSIRGLAIIDWHAAFAGLLVAAMCPDGGTRGRRRRRRKPVGRRSLPMRPYREERPLDGRRFPLPAAESGAGQKRCSSFGHDVHFAALQHSLYLAGREVGKSRGPADELRHRRRGRSPAVVDNPADRRSVIRPRTRPFRRNGTVGRSTIAKEVQRVDFRRRHRGARRVDGPSAIADLNSQVDSRVQEYLDAEHKQQEQYDITTHHGTFHKSQSDERQKQIARLQDKHRCRR